jgi:metal-responsive CopG/Arc/MetJ family transcriptional regulator
MKKKPAPPARRKPGPKPTGRMTQVMCRMPPELVDRLDRYVGINRSDRSAAIRLALDEFLPR